MRGRQSLAGQVPGPPPGSGVGAPSGCQRGRPCQPVHLGLRLTPGPPAPLILNGVQFVLLPPTQPRPLLVFSSAGGQEPYKRRADSPEGRREIDSFGSFCFKEEGSQVSPGRPALGSTAGSWGAGQAGSWGAGGWASPQATRQPTWRGQGWALGKRLRAQQALGLQETVCDLGDRRRDRLGHQPSSLGTSLREEPVSQRKCRGLPGGGAGAQAGGRGGT